MIRKEPPFKSDEVGLVGDGFRAALGMLAAAGYREVSLFLGRRRHTLPVDEALASLPAAGGPRRATNPEFGNENRGLRGLR